MIRVALRPQWLLFLLFVMVLAAIFAYLGQWQVGRAIQDAQPIDAQTETIIALPKLTEPTQAIPFTAGGHMTEVTGFYVPDSYTLLTGRLNQGVEGYWVVGRFVLSENSHSVPIALGWSKTKAVAEDVANTLAQNPEQTVTVIGRFMPTEAPELPRVGGDPFEERTLSVASLVNTWPGYSGEVYGGYVVADTPPAPLDAIDSIPPMNEGQINWLNIFYAVEWVVFAGFAFYIWWRMVKDTYEREEEEKALAEAK